MQYGHELILDLSGCTVLPVSRKQIGAFMFGLCELIKMEREDLFFWDYEDDKAAYNAAPSHLQGTSAVQFIRTSNITIHTLDSLGLVLLNIFSCKEFDADEAVVFSGRFFGGRVVQKQVFVRGPE